MSAQRAFTIWGQFDQPVQAWPVSEWHAHSGTIFFFSEWREKCPLEWWLQIVPPRIVTYQFSERRLRRLRVFAQLQPPVLLERIWVGGLSPIFYVISHGKPPTGTGSIRVVWQHGNGHGIPMDTSTWPCDWDQPEEEAHQAHRYSHYFQRHLWPAREGLEQTAGDVKTPREGPRGFVKQKCRNDHEIRWIVSNLQHDIICQYLYLYLEPNICLYLCVDV